MRIWTKAVWQMTDDGLEFLPDESESYDYSGPIAEAKKDQEQTQTNRVDVPSFLQPFIQQSSRTGSGALGSLEQLLGGDLVAGFTPDQQSAFQRVRDIAGGGGGFIPQAQQTFLSAAQGQGLDTFLPPGALASLQGAGGLDFLPGFTRDTLTAGSQINPQTLETLQRTAGGDFLFGGPGSDAAIEAAVRAAQPAILSTFGGAGVGGGTGGLSQAAIGKAASDAFARQFGQERQRQLGAAETLGRLGLAGRGQDIQAAGLLGGFAEGAAGRELQGAGILTGVANDERGRQLTAAGALPDLAFAGLDELLGIGGLQQAQGQREIDAPINAQRELLGAASGVPGAFSPLFGSTTTQRQESNPLGSLIGAGLTAASLFGTGGLGSLFGGAAGGAGSIFGSGGFAPMTTGGLLRTNNPLEFFNAPISGFGA